MNWVEGRQKTGYFIHTFFSSWKFKCDMHIIKYPKGSHIPAHTDPCDDKYNHYRLNIILKRARGGGRLILDKFYIRSRFVFFRPDVTEHEVTEVRNGTRYVLSIGWLKLKD